MRKLAILLAPVLLLALVIGAVGCGGEGEPTPTATPIPGPTPTDDWRASLVWMRGNTSDPFQDPDFLQRFPPCATPGQDYDYPESAYWIMSWWDYGCWIIDIARRLPHSTPEDKSGAPDAGLFFTEGDVSIASQMLDELGSKYVIIDYLMATGKFYAMIEWADKDRDDFFEVYYQRQADKLTPVTIYYPSYYQSMCSRLYNFGGEEWVPDNSTWVISYEERIDSEGNRFKEITDVMPFPNYEDARAFVEANPGYRIVGVDPFVSPVPLEKLEHYELVYKSPRIVAIPGEDAISEVEIFEYTP